MSKFFNAKVRTFIYATSAALKTAGLVAFGITDETWTLVVTTVLGVFDAILALSNTPVTSADSLKKEIENVRLDRD